MGNVRTVNLKTVFAFLKKNGNALLIGALGLIALLTVIQPGNSGEETAEIQVDAYSAGYATELESRLCSIISGINGVNSCEVMVTLDGGVEYIYASDSQHSQSSGENKGESSEGKSSLTVISDKQSGEKAVVVKEIYPEIKGVAVVCKGIDSPAVTLAVTDTASTVLGISADKVCVIIENQG